MNDVRGASLALVFFTLAAVLPCPGRAGTPNEAGAVQDVIPILYEHARVYLPVAAARGPLGLFVLDTGAEDCLIDTAAARTAGLSASGEAELRGAGRGAITAKESEPVTLQIGRTQLRLDSADIGPIDALLLPFTGRPIGGVMGEPFFQAHVVTVDFARREAILSDPKRYAYRGAGVRLPFHLAHGAPIAEGAVTLADGSRLRLKLLVDLGAEADLLFAEPFVRAHPGLAALKPQVLEPLGAGVGGETRFAFTRLPRLEVGALSADHLIAGLSTGGALRGEYYDAVLGAKFLQRYRVTFDYPRHEIILEPNPAPEPERFDRGGAFLIQDARDAYRFTVHFVVPGSPAAAAGLRVGDELRSIGGKSVADLTLNEVRTILEDEADPAIPIVVERDGRTVETIVRLRALL